MNDNDLLSQLALSDNPFLPAVKKRNQESKWLSLMKVYVLPLVALVVFFGILVGLIVPALQILFDKLDTNSSVQAQITELDAQIAMVQALSNNLSTLRRDLSVLEDIVPTASTAVAQYQQKLTEIASELGLVSGQASTAEQVLQIDEKGESWVLAKAEIPTLFSVSGTLADIQLFVSRVLASNDFVIIKEMDLRSSEVVTTDTIPNIAEAKWDLLINLTKYQFISKDSGENLQQAYQQVPLSASPDAEVLEFIRSKQSED